MDEDRTTRWSEFKSRFGGLELAVLAVGALLGYAGNALYARDYPTFAALLALGALTAISVFAIERLGARTANALRAMTAHGEEALARSWAHGEEALARSSRDIQEELDRQLNDVHTSVSFIPNVDGENGTGGAQTRPGYNAATAAVERAVGRIYVVGDYGPPPEIGENLDEPPTNRSEYLDAIEKKLQSRLRDAELPSVTYRRYIQRPLEVYKNARQRAGGAAGITLTRNDMIGDLQVFEHCVDVLRLNREAAEVRCKNIRVDLKMVPFLPNCPSMLLVDTTDIQFTIPTRITAPGDDFSKLGLMGVLAMRDHSGGMRLSQPLQTLLERLDTFSVPIVRTEGQ